MHLGEAEELAPRAAVKHLGDLFIQANESDDLMCLCGVFAAQGDGLPPEVMSEVNAFFDLVIEWRQFDVEFRHLSNAECDRSRLLVRNVDVWSPTGVSVARDVIVSDGRVTSVWPTGRSPAAVGIRTIEGQGALMLPGLIDAHAHFGFPGERLKKPDDHRWGSAAVTGRQMLRAGVTSARLHLSDLRGGAALRADSQDDCVPRLQAGGPGFVPDAPEDDSAVVWRATTPADAAGKVRRSKAAGFDWLAVHDGHQLRPAVATAIADAARAAGMRILGSGYTQPEFEASLKLRPDTIDYLDVSSSPEYDPRLLQAAREHASLTFVPTLGVHRRLRAYADDPRLVDEAMLYEFMQADTAAHLRASVLETLRASDSGTMKAAYPTLERKFSQLRASGRPLAMGTDCGSPAHFHRDAMWWELRAWLDFGASAKEALTAATVNGARVLRDDSVGRIEPGARADFVLYRGDAMKGEFDAAKVATVVKGGVIYVLNGVWVGPAPP